MSFSELGLDLRLVNALKTHDILTPTPIQKRSIPRILDGIDVLGISPTGTGKTFAFLLPSIHWLINAKIMHNDPSILILVPTRELVKQTQENIKIVTRGIEVFSTSIVAGVREIKQKRIFSDSIVEIIVATPGRLNQFLDEGITSLQNLNILVIDEVDRMLDMGFQNELKTIISRLPHKNKRQTLLFCSTLPKPVEKLARLLQNKSQIVEVGRSVSPDKIRHELYEATNSERFDILLEILRQPEIESVLLFTRSQDNARITVRNLLKSGLDCEEFHGGLTQKQRNKALQNFKMGEVAVLVATDIAARGIDFEDISHVISYDVPKKYDDYLHRAGRTGRISKEGVSIIIAIPEDIQYLHGIKKNLKTKLVIKRTISKPAPKFSETPFLQMKRKKRSPSVRKKSTIKRSKKKSEFRKRPRRK